LTQSEPTLSIVTISYNQAPFLRRAIDSVLSQTGVSFEYIVCDPGSTDGSREIIDSYGDAITHRIYTPDKGPADGLNKGFAQARGRIFAYLNSDDVFLPGAFAQAERYLRDHPQIDVVSGHALVTDGDDRVLRRVWSERYSRRMVAYNAAVVIQPSTFIRAEAFRRSGGFNPENRSTWDGELLIDLYQSGARFAVINEMMSCYRLHETSITNSGSLIEDQRKMAAAKFRRLMGRDRRPYDAPIGAMLRLWKHARHPRATFERIGKGRVFMRGAK